MGKGELLRRYQVHMFSAVLTEVTRCNAVAVRGH